MTAVVVALALMIHTTVTAEGAFRTEQSVTGTGGAQLLLRAPAPGSRGTTTGISQASDYSAVNFDQASGHTLAIEGSASLALPPYVGWEVNGSAGRHNGGVSARDGLLHVGVLHPTDGFRGWFLTASSPTPASCAFQFKALSPPPVTDSDPGAVGELVMAVQTSNTVNTGDINYVLVAENVLPDGQRTLVAGYSLGHLSQASEHVLRRAAWHPGPLDVAVETNGNSRLEIWVNGSLFLDATNLHMGIAPPFEPYLEVQASKTAYSVAFDGYSSVCQSDTVVGDLPDGAVATLGGRTVTAHGGSAVFPVPMSSPPVTGVLTLAIPGISRPIAFAPHTYWPGDRWSYEPGV